MANKQVVLSDVRKKPDTDIITFTAISGNNVITRTVHKREFSTWEKFADWLIHQELDFVLLPEKEKSLSIDYHTETKIDPESGEEYIDIILDNVTIL